MLWKVAIAAALALLLFTSRPAPAGATSCSLEELRALELPGPRADVVDGWVLEAEWRAGMRRACSRVPGRWSLVGNDFVRSTRLVDRLWPGVGAWERSCALSEGGWGRWVPNRGGSGAGGWLQFMAGTFYGVIGRAFASARSEGVSPPAWAWSWYSPLGHALAGAQMIFDRRRGEWTGATC